MNKSNTTFFSLFIAMNLLINIFSFLISPKYNNIETIIWLVDFVLLYFIHYFFPKFSKISWITFSAYISFNYYALNISTFKFFEHYGYNYNHIVESINNTVRLNLLKLTDIIPNLNFFSINVNFLSILLFSITIVYILFYNNRFINQIISENIFLYMVIIMFLSLIFPIKNLGLYTENIGIGDIAQLNDWIIYFINYPLFTIASIQIGLFLILTLFVFNRNISIGILYFVIFILLIIGNIILRYSNFIEVLMSCAISLWVYFFKIKVRIITYLNAIRF